MQNEFDLHHYAALVARYWGLILGLTVGAMLVAVLVTRFLLPAQYEATATVVVTKSGYTVDFEPLLQMAAPNISDKAHAALAKNAELQQQVVEELFAVLPQGLRSAEAMGRLWSVSAAGDSSILRLKVTYRDPELARDIANVWAAKFVEQMNDLLPTAGLELEQPLARADTNLRAAEQALIDFRQTDTTGVLSARIAGETQALADYRAAETTLELAVLDAQRLKQQLQSAGAGPDQTGQLAVLLTELNALMARGDSGLPVQIALDLPGEVSVSEQVQALDGLILALRAQQQMLTTARAGAETRILQAQGELQRVQTEMDRLLWARSLAEETYKALARQSEELRIAAELPTGQLHLVSPAVLPDRPSSPKAPFNIAVAALLGLATAVLWLVVVEYVLKPVQSNGRS
ncbi:MAG: hypothetical protein FJ026_07525 [Chloroflexi bacterium]|nr:hypothetical protein [Chloroflexota bacterium]